MRSPFSEISDDERSNSDVGEEEYKKPVGGRSKKEESEPAEELKVESDEEGGEEDGEEDGEEGDEEVYATNFLECLSSVINK